MISFAFQSAPLTEARGDPSTSTVNPPNIIVSIRSPHRSKGRHRQAYSLSCRTGVSIRSPHRSKGRPRTLGRCAACSCFNPLPSPKQGETRLSSEPSPAISVSIRSPHRSKGRPCEVARRTDNTTGFNPLPSPKQGETPASTAPGNRDNKFQSAPLTEARGDLAKSIEEDTAYAFQSAPLTEARGDLFSRRVK